MHHPAERSEPARRSPAEQAVGRVGRTVPSTLPSVIGNAAMGRLLRSVADQRTLARDVPTESAVRDFELSPDTFLRPMDAPAERELGPNDRPTSQRFWTGYDPISYAKIQGEEHVNLVWGMVGGSVGDDFQGENTCATRVSFAFNRIGWPVKPTDRSISKTFWNNPKTKFDGVAGDGKLYIVGAPDLERYMRRHWGKPNVHAKTTDEVKAFEATLAPGQIAIFAGPHHSGAIMGRDSAGNGYDDAYVKTDKGVMPVSAWILPGSVSSSPTPP